MFSFKEEGSVSIFKRKLFDQYIHYSSSIILEKTPTFKNNKWHNRKIIFGTDHDGGKYSVGYEQRAAWQSLPISIQ